MRWQYEIIMNENQYYVSKVSQSFKVGNTVSWVIIILIFSCCLPASFCRTLNIMRKGWGICNRLLRHPKEANNIIESGGQQASVALANNLACSYIFSSSQIQKVNKEKGNRRQRNSFSYFALKFSTFLSIVWNQVGIKCSFKFKTLKRN